MDKKRAIPQGYMTVGEVAKKMNTTVRTLQYYDKEGVLSPSAESEGGRRLYSYKDIIKLHQIQAMKYLGFSLDDIKNKLIFLDTPTDVAAMLSEHAATIREKITILSESLQAIEALEKEVLQMQSVDFKKYADIIVNLQMKNEFYWLIKHFDDKTLDHIRSRFDMESALIYMDNFTHMQNEAIRLQNDGINPESEEGQNFAKAYWEMIMEFTGGDMTMLTKLTEFAEKMDDVDNEWKQKQLLASAFIEPVLQYYFIKLGYNPFEDVQS